MKDLAFVLGNREATKTNDSYRWCEKQIQLMLAIYIVEHGIPFSSNDCLHAGCYCFVCDNSMGTSQSLQLKLVGMN